MESIEHKNLNIWFSEPNGNNTIVFSLHSQSLLFASSIGICRIYSFLDEFKYNVILDYENGSYFSVMSPREISDGHQTKYNSIPIEYGCDSGNIFIHRNSMSCTKSICKNHPIKAQDKTYKFGDWSYKGNLENLISGYGQNKIVDGCE
jgi:hypothetical protein